MKLYHAGPSPFARKVRMVAEENGLGEDIALVEVNPWTDETLRKLNPLCKVPTLALEDGTGLYDSAVICDYLDQVGGRGLIPRSGLERVRALRLEALADGVSDAAVRIVVEGRHPSPHPDVIERQGRAVLAGLDAAEAMALGEAWGIGEIALACTLGYLDFRLPQMRWAEGRPRLADWFAVFSQRAAFIATKPD